MKAKTIKLLKPCEENWENMTPTEKGKFCAMCSKNVIDFTQLSDQEILGVLKSNKNELCARLTKNQLNRPMIEFEYSSSFKMPYSKVGIGLLLAGSLLSVQSCSSEQSQTNHPIEIVESTLNKKETTKKKTNEKLPLNKTEKTVSFKGTVTYEKNLLVNAEILFVSIEKMYVTYTDSKGKFILEIPEELITNQNVFRISFNEVGNKKPEAYSIGYENETLILSEKEMETNYVYQAHENELVSGGIGAHRTPIKDPIVIDQGKEIKLKEFSAALAGGKSTCKVSSSEDYLYFNSTAAIALYGKKAKGGLYLIKNIVNKK